MMIMMMMITLDEKLFHKQISYPKVQIAFWVSPVRQVAQASINVTKPKLAWIGTIAALHVYVPFSQHKHTRNLKILKFISFHIHTCHDSYVKNPKINWSANSPIVTKPINVFIFIKIQMNLIRTNRSKSEECKNLGSVDWPNYVNQKRPRNQLPHTVWYMHGKMYGLTWRRYVSSIYKVCRTE